MTASVLRRWAALGLTMPVMVMAAPGSAAPLSFGYFFQVLISLVLVLALLFGTLLLMKRFSHGMPGRLSPLKMVGGLALGTRERVVVVELGDRWLVLGVTAQSVQLLTEQPRPEGVPSQAESAPPFQQWLQRALNRNKEHHAPPSA
ncbi:flagellar biosynthetic protein FliO [Leeia sp.]|uniref:flagellar biosynthetic protein FliO n=1 Tax=Leeia sp. TaxID=2884678 RepID=UPI0035B1DEF1